MELFAGSIMAHIGIFPAVGSGLRSMDSTGQLERLYVHLGVYAEAANLTYHTYLDYADERHLWERFYRQTGANLFGIGGGPWEAFLWPLRAVRHFKKLDLCRVMSLRGVPPALMAYWLWGIPFVVSFGNDYAGIARIHGRKTWKIRLLQRLAERFAAAIFVNNRFRANHMHQTNRRVHWVPSWVDSERFWPMPLPEHHPKRLLYVGRFVAEKNLIPVAEIARDLDIAFWCIGQGPDESGLRAAGATCLGVTRWENLPRWYAEADAFILPSLLEGHPKALLEALACGLPCAISETLNGCVDLPGVRFNPYQWGEIRHAIKTVLMMPKQAAVTPYRKEVVLAQEVKLTLACV